MDVFKTLLLDTPDSLNAITGTLQIANGGTGATSAAGARDNLLPDYAGNVGKVLTVNAGATDVEWTTNGAGTVTSVDVSGGTTGLTTSGGPVTSSGTIALAGTLVVANGGTGASTLTGYVKGTGTAALTASATIPNTDITGLGTMSTQDAATVNIDGGAIDGTTIGATTPSTGAFTTITGTTSVKIGTSSSFGGTVGQLNGANVAQANGAGMVSIASTDAVAADKGGSLALGAKATGGAETNPYPMAVISGRAVNATDLSGYFAVATSSAFGTVAERMRLTDTGLAVTGTISSTGALTVNSTAASPIGLTLIGDNSSYNPRMVFKTGTGSAAGKLDWLDPSSVLQARFSYNDSIGGAFEWKPGGSTNAMSLTSSGLAVTGALSSTGNATITGGSLTLGTSTAVIYYGPPSSNYQFFDGTSLYFRIGGSDRANISSTGVGVVGQISAGQASITPLRALHLTRIGADESLSGIAFSDGANGDYRSFITPNFSGGTAASNKLVFSVSDGTTTGTVDVFTATGAGSVGIGTTAPTSGSKLHVVAASGLTGSFFQVGANGNYVVEFLNASGTRAGYIQVDAPGTGTSYNSGSDIRLKKNIEDAPSASEIIDSIKVRSFDWKSSDTHQRFGFVAQEVDEVYPEAVSKGYTDEDTWGIDYGRFTPVLIAEVQSLRKRLAALESK